MTTQRQILPFLCKANVLLPQSNLLQFKGGSFCVWWRQEGVAVDRITCKGARTLRVHRAISVKCFGQSSKFVHCCAMTLCSVCTMQCNIMAQCDVANHCALCNDTMCMRSVQCVVCWLQCNGVERVVQCAMQCVPYPFYSMRRRFLTGCASHESEMNNQ